MILTLLATAHALNLALLRGPGGLYGAESGGARLWLGSTPDEALAALCGLAERCGCSGLA